jgi:hypothetical protein
VRAIAGSRGGIHLQLKHTLHSWLLPYLFESSKLIDGSLVKWHLW